MKFIAPRPFSDPDIAAPKLVEIANCVEAVQDGRLHIEKIQRALRRGSRQRRRLSRRHPFKQRGPA